MDRHTAGLARDTTDTGSWSVAERRAAYPPTSGRCQALPGAARLRGTDARRPCRAGSLSSDAQADTARHRQAAAGARAARSEPPGAAELGFAPAIERVGNTRHAAHSCGAGCLPRHCQAAPPASARSRRGRSGPGSPHPTAPGRTRPTAAHGRAWHFPAAPRPAFPGLFDAFHGPSTPDGALLRAPRQVPPARPSLRSKSSQVAFFAPRSAPRPSRRGPGRRAAPPRR